MKQNVIISGLKFPEGPVFDFEGNLWFVEIEGGNLSKWDRKTLIRFDVNGTPNGCIVDKNGNIWFCDSGNGAIRKFDPNEQSFQTVCTKTINGEPLKRPNDLIFDAKGNLLFSDHADGREKPLSRLLVLPKGSNEAKTISKNKFFTNGLALQSDGRTLIFSETYKQQLWIGEWDSSNLELKKERPFAKAGNGPWGPDGISFDSELNLYAAIFNEKKIAVYKSNGELKDQIECRGNRPTSCAFDPSGELGLVVTEAGLGEIISFPEFGKGLPIFYG